MDPRTQPAAISPQIVPGLVSVLIVNWNGLAYLEACLRSIQEMVAWPHEVILLDNGSTDGSAAFVEREFPEVRLIRSEVNLGFIRGTNAAALQARGEFLLLLNPDTILRTDIAMGVKLLQSDSSIGAVGASAFTLDGKLRPNCGSYPTALRLILIESIFWDPYRGPHGPTEFGARKVDWVEGSWLLTPDRVWKKAGGLDERLIMYGEDVDYCRGIRECGLASVQMPSLRYVHFGGFSPGRLPNVYAGFRWFHAKYSSRIHRRLAEIVMKLGLQTRVTIFGAFGSLLDNKKYRDRQQSALRVLEFWNRMGIPDTHIQ